MPANCYFIRKRTSLALKLRLFLLLLYSYNTNERTRKYLFIIPFNKKQKHVFNLSVEPFSLGPSCSTIATLTSESYGLMRSQPTLMMLLSILFSFHSFVQQNAFQKLTELEDDNWTLFHSYAIENVSTIPS